MAPGVSCLLLREIEAGLGPVANDLHDVGLCPETKQLQDFGGCLGSFAAEAANCVLKTPGFLRPNQHQTFKAVDADVAYRQAFGVKLLSYSQSFCTIFVVRFISRH